MHTLFNIVPRLSRELSGKNKMYFFILLCKLWYFVVTRKIFKIKKTMHFYFEYNRVPIPMHLSSNIDIAALKEIYILKEYQWELRHSVDTILDLGAHIGDTTLYYHAMYPNAKIIAVEPSPASFDMLKKNTQGIENIKIIRGAVGETNGEATLFITKSSLGNSINKRDSSVSEVRVRQYDLSTLIQMLDVDMVDLIKFDIEGAEEKLFNNADSLSQAYIGEVHLDLMQTDLDSFLENFGHFQNSIKCVSKDCRYILHAERSHS